jgi:hypothetical protein
MGIFSRLFGRGGSAGAESEGAPGEAVEHKGYRIRPAPFRDGSQFQTAGIIEKDFPDGRKEHRFIRAEKHASRDEAVSFTVTKARQIIDERGDGMFEAK